MCARPMSQALCVSRLARARYARVEVAVMTQAGGTKQAPSLTQAYPAKRGLRRRLTAVLVLVFQRSGCLRPYN